MSKVFKSVKKAVKKVGKSLKKGVKKLKKGIKKYGGALAGGALGFMLGGPAGALKGAMGGYGAQKGYKEGGLLGAALGGFGGYSLGSGLTGAFGGLKTGGIKGMFGGFKSGLTSPYRTLSNAMGFGGGGGSGYGDYGQQGGEFGGYGGYGGGGRGGPLMGLFDAYTSYQTGKDTQRGYERAFEAANPFAPHRARYATKLNTLYDDPSSIEQDPGYQWALGQGEKAMTRTAAARGGRLGGRALIEAQKFGQDLASQYRQQEINNLSQLAGAGFTPSGLGYGAGADAEYWRGIRGAASDIGRGFGYGGY